MCHYAIVTKVKWQKREKKETSKKETIWRHSMADLDK